MRKSAEKRTGFAGFDPQGCVLFLKGRHPHKTAQGVEADSGVPARTVERWLAWDCAPNVKAFGRLVAAYGMPFLAAALPGVAWIARLAALAEHEALAAQIAALQSRQAEIAGRPASPERGR